MKKNFGLIWLILMISVSTSFAEEVDFNEYYSFPLSIGAEYQSLSHITGFETGEPFTSFEISGNIRLPIPGAYCFQPMLKGGYMSFDSLDSGSSEQWDHYCYFGEAGILYSNRFSKNIELGVYLMGGYSHALFSGLADDVVASNRLISEGGLKLSLIPSFNLSIDFSPAVRYFHGLEEFLTDFNGLSVGFGISGSFRFGDDPDSSSSIIRSLKIEPLITEPLFGAMQSYYIDNSFGKVTITNIEGRKIENLEVTFFQPGFMDSPSVIAVIDEFDAEESKTLDLTASFNSAVFETEGITPLTGELITSYSLGGKAAEQRKSVSYDLYDSRSIVWNDDRKIAAFITTADSALQNYTSYIKTTCRDLNLDMYNKNLQSALQTFEALNTIGILYQSDPTAPFSSVSGDSCIVDTVSLPRTTLKKSTGDCDDLTVLYSTLLETLGIETAVITVPGHIYTAFNTKAAGREYKNINPDRLMTINIDDELWIPVEITMIGKGSFLDAWRKGADQWNAYENSPQQRAIHLISDCRKLYRPVGLMQTDLGLQYGSANQLTTSVDYEIGHHMENLASEFKTAAAQSGKLSDYNKLGIFYASFNLIDKALSTFRKASIIAPGKTSPLINIGNIYYLNEDYQMALIEYKKALAIFEEMNRTTSSSAVKLKLNIARVYYEQEDFKTAEALYTEAESLNPELAVKYSFLGTPIADGAARASEAGSTNVIFIYEDEDE